MARARLTLASRAPCSTKIEIHAARKTAPVAVLTAAEMRVMGCGEVADEDEARGDKGQEGDHPDEEVDDPVPTDAGGRPGWRSRGKPSTGSAEKIPAATIAAPKTPTSLGPPTAPRFAADGSTRRSPTADAMKSRPVARTLLIWIQPWSPLLSTLGGCRLMSKPSLVSICRTTSKM
jgi:hypothetical protein